MTNCNQDLKDYPASRVQKGTFAPIKSIQTQFHLFHLYLNNSIFEINIFIRYCVTIVKKM